MLLELPALRTLFANINRIDVTHAQCLTITLHRPDYWLPFRLASDGSVLAHPDEPTVGSGPFRLKLFSPELVRLENHPRYHLNHPLIQAVEYWIAPSCLSTIWAPAAATRCRLPLAIRISWQIYVRSAIASASGFATGARQSPRLSKAQAQRLVSLIHRSSLLKTLPLDEDLITPATRYCPAGPFPWGQRIRMFLCLNSLRCCITCRSNCTRWQNSFATACRSRL